MKMEGRIQNKQWGIFALHIPQCGVWERKFAPGSKLKAEEVSGTWKFMSDL